MPKKQKLKSQILEPVLSGGDVLEDFVLLIKPCHLRSQITKGTQSIPVEKAPTRTSQAGVGGGEVGSLTGCSFKQLWYLLCQNERNLGEDMGSSIGTHVPRELNVNPGS